MKTETIKASEFVAGRSRSRSVCGRHSYRARLEHGGIHVEDASGNPVEVHLAGTTDNRTVYAYTEEGFIGGWQYPHRKQPFSALVEAINQGILYPSMDALPKR